MIRYGLCVCFCLFWTASVLAQETPPPETPAAEPPMDAEYMETQKLITINQAASTRDKEIDFLNKQIEEAIKMIAIGREDTATLRETKTSLETELQSTFISQDALNAELNKATTEKEKLLSELEIHVAGLADLLSLASPAAATLSDRLETINVELRNTIDEKAKVEQTLADANRAIEDNQKALAEQRAEIKRLTARASGGEEKAEQAQSEIRTLNAQLAKIRKQLEGTLNALKASQERTTKQEVKIADLGKRLNLALAERVQELSEYRSEFFGRLRKALGERQDIRIVGDRFVFQSEVLFASGSADIDPGGAATMEQLASTLRDVARTIPRDIEWVLRVDGHTDRIPIRNVEFASNWELSSARAISVVKFLIERGIPPGRLAATGFGEYQPLDPRTDEIAYRRNRRIEFKLTQR